MQETLFDDKDTPEKDGQDNGETPPEPGFKKTKVGWIPKEWDPMRLRDLIQEINAGYSAKSEDRTIEDEEVGVLKVSAASYGVFQPEEHKAVRSEDEDKVKTSPRAGDLIMSRSSGSPSLVGACVHVKKDYPNLYLPDTLWQIKVKEDVSARWLNYALASGRMRSRIRASSYGTSGMKKLSMTRLRSLKIAVPPLDEQQKIAEILGIWDRAIEGIDDLIAAKERRKKALMQRLLTGKTRLPEFGESDWHDVKLGDLFEERKEKGRGDLDLLAVTKEDGVIDRDKLDRRDTSSSDKSNYLRVAPGDIAYNTMRMWQGVSGLSELEGIVSPAYTVCIPGSDIDPQFAAYLFQLPKVVNDFRRYSQGLVSDTLNLRFDNFAEVEVHIPQSLEEQKGIAEVLSSCDEDIAVLHDEREALQRQKKGVMQRLLRGKIRVSTETTSPQVEA
jgi:type I restriction enzyme S subunit